MGSKPHVKTGDFLTFWSDLNQEITPFFTQFSPFYTLLLLPLPPGFMWGFDISVRKMRMLHNGENSVFSCVIAGLGLIIGRVERVLRGIICYFLINMSKRGGETPGFLLILPKM